MQTGDIHQPRHRLLGQQPRRGVIEEIKAKMRLSPLYNYSPSVDALRCPGDRRGKRMPGTQGWAYDSYSRIGGMNGESWTGATPITKQSAVVRPSNMLVFIEDADWRCYSVGCFVRNASEPSAVDPIAIYHNEKGTLGYADGHAGWNKWLDNATIEAGKIASQGRLGTFGPACMGPRDTRFMAEAYVHRDWPPACSRPDGAGRPDGCVMRRYRSCSSVPICVLECAVIVPCNTPGSEPRTPPCARTLSSSACCSWELQRPSSPPIYPSLSSNSNKPPCRTPEGSSPVRRSSISSWTHRFPPGKSLRCHAGHSTLRGRPGSADAGERGRGNRSADDQRSAHPGRGSCAEG